MMFLTEIGRDTNNKTNKSRSVRAPIGL